jgi:hypothetical protein
VTELTSNVHRVFGVELADLKAGGVAFDAACNVPTLVVTCVEFILEGDRAAEQGIFRLAGDHSRIQALRNSVDQGTPPCVMQAPLPSRRAWLTTRRAHGRAHGRQVTRAERDREREQRVGPAQAVPARTAAAAAAL